MANEARKLLKDFVLCRDKINQLAGELSRGKIIAFDKISLKEPDLSIPIHGFYTSISWFYVTFFETGKTAISFLSERAIAFGLSSEAQLKKHQILIHSFRTYLQHNLDFESREDFAKRQCCVDWMQKQLTETIECESEEKLWPKNPQQWNQLLIALFEDSVKFVRSIYNALEVISKDEASKETIMVWESRLNRQLSAEKYDHIITEVASDMGLEYIDAEALRKRYIEKWNKKLGLLRDNCNLLIEARRLIEQTLLNEEKLPIPITGRDIINELGIPPGPRIKEILECAQKLFQDKPRNRSELLSALKELV